MLFLSGEEAAGLFVIIDGKVRVFQHNAEGREHVMHVDTAGAVMAEVPIFDDGPYPASAWQKRTRTRSSSASAICANSVSITRRSCSKL